MATIRKRKTQWEAQVRLVGQPSECRRFSTYREARDWARVIETDRKLAPIPLTRGSGHPDVTLGEVLVRYQSQITPEKRGADRERFKLDLLRRQDIAKMALESVTSGDIARFRDRRLRVVTCGTVRRELAILRHCFEIARKEWGYVTLQNPVSLIRLPPPSKARTRRITSDEMEIFAKALTVSKNPIFRQLVSLGLTSGMRRGELLALRWDHVDFNSATAYLPQTKNGEPRRVPLSPQAIQNLHTLAETRNARPEPPESHHGAFQEVSDLVFPISANALRLSWERAKRRAGIKDFRFHDLRHEAISRFFEMGLSVPEVALISGHKDPRMLFRYTHLKAENVAQKLAVLGGAGTDFEKGSGNGRGG